MTLRFIFRSDCSLCDAAWAELEEFLGREAAEHGTRIGVERIDLADHAGLEAQYGRLVPVITWRDEEICRYFFDEAAVRKCLRPQATAV